MSKIKFVFLIAVVFFSMNILNAQFPVNEEGKSPFVQVVKDIRRSVVNVKVEYEVTFDNRGTRLPFNDDFFKYFFPEPFQNPEKRSRKSMAMGSGFIFKRDKNDVYILTNNHVVEKGEEGTIIITLADKAKYEAEIIGLDADTDLAVVKIEVENDEETVVAPFGDSEEIEIGDWAIAIGNPFGQLGLERTVTVGVISATGRANLRFGQDSPIYQDYIQTDAAINPGNSGGPLVDIHGEVIGVNAAITSTSGGNVGIGFAIPINLAKKVSNDLIEKGRVVRAYMGILPQDITAELKESFDLDAVMGVLVSKVEEDTPAEKSGLKRGDVITHFDGKEVPNVAKFRLYVANSEIDQNIPITIIRDNKEKHLLIKLVERPEELSQNSIEKESENSAELGITVAGLDSDLAQQYEIEEDEGVIIKDIESNSPAALSNLRVGDVIIEVNRKKIKNVKDFRKTISESDEDTILFYVRKSSGNYQYISLKIN